MFRVLFLFFVIVPIIEISVLMQVGELLGAWPTVGIVIFTAWLGAKYVRQQGLRTLQSVQEKSAQGEIPSGEIITGVMLLIAGILLVTPGFVTDIFGLSLLVPAVRDSLMKMVKKYMVINQSSATSSQFHGGLHASSSSHLDGSVDGQDPFSSANGQNGKTIEGEYERKE